MSNLSPKVHIISHPIARAKLSIVRNKLTGNREFRESISDLGYILALEASRDLEEKTFDGSTPVGDFTGSEIVPSIGLLPIMRAGIGMVDPFLRLLPDARVYHLGLFREKVSLQPVECECFTTLYYSKLPSTPNVDHVFLLDPVVATGGTACAALQMILDWGVPIEKVKLLSILGSREGITAVSKQFPNLEIWTIAIDPILTQQGIIVPGLGDVGDRLNNTPNAH
ncbi:UDP-N-acetylglucosamine 1-carboxyvinyltransferase [Cantharellus anzutake]|uniref:UDP-N-acetylglucosamine 1-carboxyvinyltransferase n=1 Tax=Cantharellus anzutake TaxID=1750568 RepID=UPI001907E6AE|nr:UDP-N-acetylglucosamine 1-carboxyvinyltransferase [Cantharellus anzutake]KAF8324482.1 UDP-N-acetylglucosamine 1-carboxyvinyltransferase [Cantharellus anzutake]